MIKGHKSQPEGPELMAEAFQSWIPLRDLAICRVPNDGAFPAVYALRDSVRGNILKFGCAGCLRNRIFGNYFGGVGGATTQRIHNELFGNGMIHRVEIAWLQTRDRDEALCREKQFRQAYKKTHGHRPSWDFMD